MLPKALKAHPIAFFGGVYSNYLALEALLEDARERGIERLYCLGDLGAFGPLPDRACDIPSRHSAALIGFVHQRIRDPDKHSSIRGGGTA